VRGVVHASHDGLSDSRGNPQAQRPFHRT
jgi:hypothetical protein